MKTVVVRRKVEAAAIYNAIVDFNVTHFCGAPIVLGLVINANNWERRKFDHTVEVMTAAAPPPASVLEKMERSGFHLSLIHISEPTRPY